MKGEICCATFFCPLYKLISMLLFHHLIVTEFRNLPRQTVLLSVVAQLCMKWTALEFKICNLFVTLAEYSAS